MRERLECKGSEIVKVCKEGKMRMSLKVEGMRWLNSG
jgi:hypothetical protein